MTTDTIDATTLHGLLRSGEEIALIDLREQGDFGRRHILRAVNIPLSRLELMYRRMLPRRDVPIILTGDGSGLAARGAEILTFAGWTDVRLLDGATDAWEASGYPVFSGVNVPSKAFGEYVETRFGTPHISAAALRARLDAGEKIAILDSRPFGEFTNMSIPGGIDVPGAELVHRARQAVPDPETPIVVNCAGRTRSIIGAQSLINAGVPNPVAALENGTMGWMLAGLECARGETATAPPPEGDADAWARAAAAKVADRFGVPKVDAATVEAWENAPDRTTYLLDVRTREEFEAGHWPGARHAPGGQLVQATDEHVAVQNARIVLMDDTETRAIMTASWLIQMGWPDVAVLAGGVGDRATETGAVEDFVYELELMPVTWISAADAIALDGVPIVDFSSSLSHRKGHPKGARFAIRARALADLSPLIRGRDLLLTARDPRVAALAAQDLSRAGVHRVRVIDGGGQAWEDAGGAMESGLSDPLSAEDDVFHKPYDLELDKAAMQRYIDWEVALVPQVDAEGTLKWPAFPA
jgi:rhodanese-related sulfurtransferase